VTTILVVDDAPLDRRLAGSMLEGAPGIGVLYAADGREAMRAVAAHAPDVVVTDLRMPAMDGLQLVEALRASRPGLPVILMTAHGSEDIAAAALRAGAASYVPKRELAGDLLRTVQRVLALARAASPPDRVLRLIEASECRLVLPNDLDLVAPVVTYLRSELARLGTSDAAVSMQVGVALDEAISNAVHHGNLEVSSKLREDGIEHYLAKIEERSRTPPFADRRVHVTAHLARDRASFTVGDEGPGFDVGSLPDPCDPENLDRSSGRGVLLVRTFMDEVRFNERGNEVTMVKRFS
jgi:CheY-like chemotaxis protein/anti-sigma regulatory factor (Ser/Thr protein kinase)